jgi:hypothetical protein
MPWCDSCAKFWNPNSLTPEGACPTCGHRFSRSEAPPVTTAAPAAASVDEDDDAWLNDYKAPWHFKLMIAMAVVYLTFRLIQMVSWVV